MRNDKYRRIYTGGKHLRRQYILVILSVSIALVLWQCKESDRKAMKPFFEQAVVNKDAAYIKARNMLLQESAQTLSFFDNTKFAPDDWLSLRTAEMIHGWIKHPDLFQRVERFSQGKAWNAVQRAGGKRPVDEMVEKIAAMGSVVLPCVLEKLIKDTQSNSDYTYSVLFQAVVLLRDPRSIQPVFTLVDDEELSIDRRVMAVDALISMNVASIEERIKQIVLSEDQPLALRAQVSCYLMILSPDKFTSTMLGIMQDEGQAVELRAAAAESLGFGKPDVVKAALEDIAVKEIKVPIKLGALLALQKVGDQHSITVLEHALKSHNDSQVRELANETAEEIEVRLESE